MINLDALAARVYLAAEHADTSPDDSPYVVVPRDDYDALIGEIRSLRSELREIKEAWEVAAEITDERN